MNLIQKLMERLRTLVGVKGWDYCVLWVLSDDQRYIEWMDCCCGGTDNSEMNSGDQVQFPVSPILACRDVIFQHQRTKPCELLAHLPSSMPLDSGIHAQTLLSNQPRWFNFSNNPDLGVMEGTVGTRLLIPVPGGLIELFVTKQVSEDQQIIDYVTSQCSILMEQEAIINSTNMDADFSVENQENNEEKEMNNNNNKSNEFEQALVSPVQNMSLSHDISASSLKFLHQFNYSEEHINKNHDHIFFEGNKEHQGNDCLDSIKQENGKSDYISDCSDQIDDENDANGNNRRRNNNNNNNNNVRGTGAKNLHAERKRRKRLNGRLYDLRALVPKITSLNKAAILGDAIDFVNELKQQEKELEAELQENSDEEDVENGNLNKMIPQEILNQDHGSYNNVVNGFQAGSSEVASCSKLNHKALVTPHDKGQQMEVQVEVAQINGNEFYVNVFCEHKAGGFVRLMDALDSLGLEVKNVNVTSCLGLVSNIFKVEKKENEMVQADYVREYLLELTRDPPKGWHENGNGIECHHHLQNGNAKSHPHHLHH